LLVGKTDDLKPAQAIVAATPATAVAAAAPVDEAALDSAVTSLGPVPYYSLSQIVENLQTLTGSHVAAESNPGERYLDEQEIGEGGTSVVYRAKDRRMRRDVALKRFKSISRTDKDRDYALEMKSASHINHPYVVSIYDADIDEKGRYIAMELIEGFNMEEAIKLRELNFDINRFINFAEQALEGLEATHKAGLLHLDLKPSNIMLCEQGGGRDIIKLIDYGRAQLIQNEAGDAPKGRGLEGTIFFCSPEQILREDLDVRTDLYALGTVFYWMLTHRRPFDGGNPISIMSAHLQHIVTDISEIIPNIPKWLGEWVMSLIALEKDDRPQSAAEALDTLLNGRDEQKVTKFRA
jgi:serine/threonine-protein kinase